MIQNSSLETTWRRELEHIPDLLVPRKTLDFIESILVIDPKNRLRLQKH